jgi:hypothetical protein
VNLLFHKVSTVWIESMHNIVLKHNDSGQDNVTVSIGPVGDYDQAR